MRTLFLTKKMATVLNFLSVFILIASFIGLVYTTKTLDFSFTHEFFGDLSMGQFVMFVLDVSLVVMSLLYLLVYRVDNDLLFEQYDYVSRYRSSGGFYLAKKDGDLIITDVDYQVVTSWEKLKDFRKHRRDACVFANRELPKPRVNSKFIKIYRIKLNDLLRA